MKTAWVVCAGLWATAAWARADAAADREIEQSVHESYILRDVLRSQIVVKAEEGAVTLSGTVKDWNERELAGEAAKNVPGVVSVTNELDVSAPHRERADGWIALRIRGLLLMRPRVSAAQTDVAVHDGGVVLSGVAESEEQKELTEVYARGVQGVKSVTNEIRVRGRNPGGERASLVPRGARTGEDLFSAPEGGCASGHGPPQLVRVAAAPRRGTCEQGRAGNFLC